MKYIYIYSIIFGALTFFINPKNADAQTISGVNNGSYNEGSAPIIIHPGFTVTGGSAFGGGYLLFDLTNGTVSDQLGIKSDANPNASGAISVSGSGIFLGNGSGNTIVGSIDGVLNGVNGQDLRINFTSNFANPSFEQGITGWTPVNQRVDLGVTQILGFTTPNDPTNPANSGGDGDAPQSATYNNEISTAQKSHGNQSLRLFSNMTTQFGCDVVHGPYVSSAAFQAINGDILSFDWRAINGSDSYDVFGYLLNMSTGAATIVLNATGTSSNWATASVTVPATGTYRFVFVSGTYDQTCGRAAGASLYIDNFKVFGDNVNASVISSIAQHVTYRNACGTSKTTRNLTVTLGKIDNSTTSASSTMALNTFPPVAITKNISVSLNSSGSVTIADNAVNDGSTDDCGITFNTSKKTFSCADKGDNTVILTVTDTYGNTDTESATVTVIDDLLPTITCPANTTVQCASAVPSPNTALVTANDNCPGVTKSFVSDVVSNSTCTNKYTITRTYRATDAQGNIKDCSQIITVNDNTAPALTGSAYTGASGIDACKANAVSAAPFDASLAITGYTDNCGGAVTASLTGTNVSGTDCGWTITYTYRVQDACGNTLTNRIYRNSGSDQTAPEITTEASDRTVECDGSGNSSELSAWLSSNGGASASDACNNVTWTNNYVFLSDDCGATGSVYVTYTATDDCDNQSTTSATFIIEDETNPVWTAAPTDKEIECDGEGNSGDVTTWLNSFSGSDACSGSAAVTNNYSGLSDLCGATGKATVTFTLTDDCGNYITKDATFKIKDETAPVWTAAPTDKDVECDGSGNSGDVTTWLNSLRGSDACSGSATVTNNYSGLSDLCGATGSATVTFTLTDDCGNYITQDATFTIKDTKAPSITCPQNVTINCQDDSSPSSTGKATGADECGGVTISSSDASTQNTNASTAGHYNYTITRTWKATDDCGNSSTCDQLIIVEDITKPVAKCKNFTLDLTGGTGTVTGENIDAGSYDNCDDDLTLSVSPNTFNCSNAGTNQVTLTVTDASGNHNSCTATVTVQYQPSCSISVTPSDNTYTGGVVTNIYLGYGPQSAKLTANATGGSGFTYSWSPSDDLSCIDCQSPVFTPTAEGNYTFTVTVTNSNGCKTTCKVTFCVKDVQVSGTSGSGKKVYLCHLPSGNPSNANTLSISVNAVNSHLTEHSGDALGKCGATCYSNKRTVISELVLDIEDIEITSSPNPFNQTFKVNYISSSDKESTISVYGITGNLVEKTVQSGYSNEVELGNNLPAGIYTVSFTQGQIVKVFRMIKVN